MGERCVEGVKQWYLKAVKESIFWLVGLKNI